MTVSKPPELKNGRYKVSVRQVKDRDIKSDDQNQEGAPSAKTTGPCVIVRHYR
jgi:hypothetical protein